MFRGVTPSGKGPTEPSPPELDASLPPTRSSCWDRSLEVVLFCVANARAHTRTDECRLRALRTLGAKSDVRRLAIEFSQCYCHVRASRSHLEHDRIPTLVLAFRFLRSSEQVSPTEYAICRFALALYSLSSKSYTYWGPLLNTALHMSLPSPNACNNLAQGNTKHPNAGLHPLLIYPIMLSYYCQFHEAQTLGIRTFIRVSPTRASTLETSVVLVEIGSLTPESGRIMGLASRKCPFTEKITR